MLGIHAGLLPDGQTVANAGRISDTDVEMGRMMSETARGLHFLYRNNIVHGRVQRSPGTRSDPVVEETSQCAETHCQNIRILYPDPSPQQPGSTIVGISFVYGNVYYTTSFYLKAKNPGRSQSPWPHFLFHDGRQQSAQGTFIVSPKQLMTLVASSQPTNVRPLK